MIEPSVLRTQARQAGSTARFRDASGKGAHSLIHVETTMPVPRLGSILRKHGAVTENELHAALEKQGSKFIRLGDLLVAEHGVAQASVDAAISTQMMFRDLIEGALSEVPLLGELLIRCGIVHQDHVEHALRLQEATGKPLGVLLVESGWLEVSELAHALAEQHKLRNIALAALIGVSVTLAPVISANADQTPLRTTQSVEISLTIPERISIEASSDQQDLLSIEGVGDFSPSASTMLVQPFEGPARILVNGSGSDGALVATTVDGQAFPYIVEIQDPMTGVFVELVDSAGGLVVDTGMVPQLVNVRFDGVAPHEVGPAIATGTLTITVGPAP